MEYLCLGMKLILFYRNLISLIANKATLIKILDVYSGGKGDDIWLLRGNVDSVDESEVIGDGCSSKYWSLIHFHALFMFMGWGLLLVAGVFVARYFRNKDPLWFHLHRVFQVKIICRKEFLIRIGLTHFTT